MPSPLGYEHGLRDGDVSDWLGHYKRFTPGVLRALNATIQLGDYGEPQPDGLLLIPAELGGLTRFVDGFIMGPPELVVEVGKTSRRLDLVGKKHDYERAGVPEYLFVGIDPAEILWFLRGDGRFVAHPPDPDGLFRSRVFPGLWLDAGAMIRGDLEEVYAALDRGLASPEHAEFIARLAGMGRHA